MSIASIGYLKLNQTSVRELKKAQHRKMLLDATIGTISDHGIAGASISKIIKKAGLSRGMVHLHFENKDHLVAAAAQDWGRTYYAVLDAYQSRAGDGAQEQLEALINADLNEENLNRKTINVWFAFRGEARAHNSFAEYSDTRDGTLREKYMKIFRVLAEDDDDQYRLARDATHGTIALLEGMWADYFLHSETFNRESAKRIVFRFVSALFPGKFNLNGAIRINDD